MILLVYWTTNSLENGWVPDLKIIMYFWLFVNLIKLSRLLRGTAFIVRFILKSSFYMRVCTILKRICLVIEDLISIKLLWETRLSYIFVPIHEQANINHYILKLRGNALKSHVNRRFNIDIFFKDISCSRMEPHLSLFFSHGFFPYRFSEEEAPYYRLLWNRGFHAFPQL